MRSKNDKQVFMSAILVALLVIATLGGTYAWFNYTRIGDSNRLVTGTIEFLTEQGDTIELNNAFPIDGSDLSDTTNVGEVSINVRGRTSYSDGVEYEITAVNVNNTVEVNNVTKALPISIVSTVTGNLGTERNDYFDVEERNESMYKKTARSTVVEGEQLLVGYIKGDSQEINGNINIKAYINKDKIAITDTEDENSDWIGNRVVFTTDEWNEFSNEGHEISFQVKVEANEGLWVEEQFTVNKMNNLSNIPIPLDDP